MPVLDVMDVRLPVLDVMGVRVPVLVRCDGCSSACVC